MLNEIKKDITNPLSTIGVGRISFLYHAIQYKFPQFFEEEIHPLSELSNANGRLFNISNIEHAKNFVLAMPNMISKYSDVPLEDMSFFYYDEKTSQHILRFTENKIKELTYYPEKKLRYAFKEKNENLTINIYFYSSDVCQIYAGLSINNLLSKVESLIIMKNS